MEEKMIEYSIAKKEHLPMILELYKQLIPEENPIDIIVANKIWEKIDNNGIKYFKIKCHITFKVYDVLPARIRACEARPGLAKCGWKEAWEWSIAE